MRMTLSQTIAKISDEAYEDAKTGNDRSDVYRSRYYDTGDSTFDPCLHEFYVNAYDAALKKLNDNTGKILGKIDLSKFKK